MLDADTVLEVCTSGEFAGIRVQDRETLPEAIERIRSALQDLVAESTSGWGQQRR